MTEPQAERGHEIGGLDLLRAGGRVGRDLGAVAWGATSVGAPEGWPTALRTVVHILLTSRFSMWMAWGPELTFFCNDAYRRDTLGKKYPWALGRPAREVWAEIWPEIGPRIEQVLATGVATWDQSLQLFLERNGYPEETYHTFSYSPLIDDAGSITGMLCVVSEDTERVIGERRLATLRSLGAETAAGRDEQAYLQAMAAHLAASNQSLPFSMLYLFDEDGTAELACTAGITAGHAAAPRRIVAQELDPCWPVAELEQGRAAVVEEIDRRFEALPTGAWDQPPTTAVLLPVPAPGSERPYGFLVVGANRHRPLDDTYLSFLRLIASQLASGIAAARAYATERRRAEELAELDRAKTLFFTNVSHELRTPLTLLLGPAEDALSRRDPPLADADRERMEMIARNAHRLLRMVNALLDFSRLESGSVNPSFEPVDLAQYTAELASMFRPAIEHAGLAFEVDCNPLVKPVYVDREMWAKIVLNLLSNALKFTFTGGIGVRIEQRDEFVRLSVSDTGVGVAAADQPRLFDRFHRVDGAQARTHEGSGIGLALVDELARLHGGRVGVTSTYGQGSEFTVEVPRGAEHLPSEQLSREPRSISAEREAAGFLAEADRWTHRAPSSVTRALIPSADQATVLVVDDNADMREYAAEILRQRHSVQTAADGEEALELAKARPPDLVLTDVMMPRLDGFGLLQALRAEPTTAAVPVVMLSARAGEEGLIEGLEAGADDYVIKPFSARELLARVHANLELDRIRRTRDELERRSELQNQAERLAEVGSWEIDLETGSVEASPQLLRMLRMTEGDLAAQSRASLISHLVHPEDRGRVSHELEAALATGEPLDLEARVIYDAGGERWMRARGEVLRDEHGGPARLRGFVQDLTQRREAERALTASAVAREAAEREHRIADELQRSLLPIADFHAPQLDVAAYYQPGVQGTRVGGDWHDAINLGAGRVALVIGDVAGRGVLAAGVMGQLRAATRAYAALDLSPPEILALLDATVCDVAPGQLVTCIYAIHDSGTDQIRYANAGHLPPLIALPSQPAHRLDDATDPPLGIGVKRFAEHTAALPAGATIVLYTDGLVERRGSDLDARIDALAEQLQADSLTPKEITGKLVGDLVPEGSEDDVAILVARPRTDPQHRTTEIEIPCDAAFVREARSFATARLSEWGFNSRVLEDVALITSELVTNAIVHGRPPLRLRLRQSGSELAVEVEDGAGAMPRKLESAPDDLHGRGLSIVAHVATRWGARPNGRGKIVWAALEESRTPARQAV